MLHIDPDPIFVLPPFTVLRVIVELGWVLAIWGCRTEHAIVRPELVSENKTAELASRRESEYRGTYPLRLNQPFLFGGGRMGLGQIRSSFHLTFLDRSCPR
jgi:hypothetical protein